jgi:hypothetical protein
MTYDNWKATNPADESLGPEPFDPIAEGKLVLDAEAIECGICPVCGCEISADETPCEGLEHGYQCGVALLQEGGAA